MVLFLNVLYKMFDSQMEKYEVFKVKQTFGGSSETFFHCYTYIHTYMYILRLMEKLYKAIIFLRRTGLFCPCQIPGSHYNCAFHLQGGHSERLPHAGLRPPGEERGQTCDRDCGLCS